MTHQHQKNLKNFLSKVFLGVVILLSFPKSVLAIAKFNTAYQINYTVNTDGSTHVKFLVNQKNNLSAVYATEYGLSISQTKLSEVKVTDVDIPVKADVTKSLNQTTISFSFINKIVGKDKNHFFSIEYDTNDIATKFGSTWQINIPRLEQTEDLSSQTIVLSVPGDFQKPAYINPQPTQVTDNTYFFSGTTIGNRSISAVFGQFQYYKVDLAYYLNNDQNNDNTTEIALPPDTTYQTVFIKSIEPKPIAIRSDADGNWLAKYNLKSHESKKITLQEIIKIDFTPHKQTLTNASQYISKNNVINYDDTSFNTSELENLKSPKSIYDYIVDKFKYDYQKINRPKTKIITASESLAGFSSAICTDFTNVFIALSRKVGIPTRELEGYAISENVDLKPINQTQDILHAWPEYYNSDKQTWIQIDPTWENTTHGVDYFNKLDFNHIVFVIHGIDPQFPVTAGGYKDSSKKTRDVFVDPTNETIFPEADVSFTSEFKNGKPMLVIENRAGVGLHGSLTTGDNDYITALNSNISLPPFSQTDVQLTLKKQPLFTPITINTIIYLNGQQYPKQITVPPTLQTVGILAGIGGVLVVIAGVTWYIYLRKRRSKTPLYR